MYFLHEERNQRYRAPLFEYFKSVFKGDGHRRVFSRIFRATTGLSDLERDFKKFIAGS